MWLRFSPREMFRRFARCEQGSATVEAVIWFPVFALILCLVADAALIFSKQALVMRVVQDANRAMSVGRLMTAAEAQDYIRLRIATISPNATVVTTVQAGVIISTVTMPSSDLTATRFVEPFGGLNVSVSSQQMSEA